MGIITAQCDMEHCQKIINVEEGEEVYDLGDVKLCSKCYSEMYEDLVPPDSESEEGYD